MSERLTAEDLIREMQHHHDKSMEGTVSLKNLPLRSDPDPFQEIRIREESKLNVRFNQAKGGHYE